MTASKWAKIHEKLLSTTTEEASYLACFKNNLVAFLKQDIDPNGEANQPEVVIRRAVGKELGDLSRILDAFPFPAPTFREISALIKNPDDLRKHMQAKLDLVLPVILNAEGTALNQKIIDAIGKDNYEALKKKGDEQQIALQFVQAVLVSYGQRVVDNTSDSEQKRQAFESMTAAMGALATEATLKGLPAAAKKIKSIELDKILTGFSNLLAEPAANELGFASTNSHLDTALDWLGCYKDSRNEQVS